MPTYWSLVFPWLVENLQVMEGLSLGLRLTPPEGCPDLIKSLMISCWELIPSERITFSKIVEILSSDNLKISLGHSNTSYGVVTSLNQRKYLTPLLERHKDNENTDVNLNRKESTPSFPILSNFSNVSSPRGNGDHHEMKKVLETNPSTETVEYTLVLLDEKVEIDDES